MYIHAIMSHKALTSDQQMDPPQLDVQPLKLWANKTFFFLNIPCDNRKQGNTTHYWISYTYFINTQKENSWLPFVETEDPNETRL